MSIEPVSSADKGKLAETLGALAREDPTFTFRVNEETGQTLISGMGELHLEILKNRIKRDFKLNVHVGRPRVSYRETIKRAVKRVEGSCIRQTGGSGLYAKISIDLEPETQPKGAPVLHVVNKLKGGVIPAEFLPAIEAGLREEAKSGGRTGYPLVDLKVTLVDGATHDVDSNELAFRFAAGDALRKAVQEAGSVLLEPIMKHRDRHARRLPGQYHRRPVQPAGPDRPHQQPRQADGHRRPGTAREDVRLFHRRAQPEPGQGGLHHGAARIRGGA